MNLEQIKDGGIGNPLSITTSGISDSIFDKMPKVGNVKTEDDEKPDLEDEDDKPEDETKTDENEFEEDEKDKGVKTDTIIKTKSVEDKSDDNKDDDKGDDEDSIIPAFSSKYGEVEGEFSEDLDGVMGYFDKVLEKEKSSSILEGQQQLFTKRPELKALNDHLEKGFGLDSFLRRQELIDWDSIELKAEDPKALEKAEQIYRMAKAAKGDDEDEINDAVETAKDKGNLLERGSNAKEYLKKIQEGDLQKQQQAEKDQRDAFLKQQKEFLEEAEVVLKSGDINGVKLPADEIKKLREYSLVEDKEGKTQRDRKIETLTVKEGLLLDYLLMNNFKQIGVKSNTNVDTKTVFQKLKQKNDEKTKVNLSSDTATRPNIKTLFTKNN